MKRIICGLVLCAFLVFFSASVAQELPRIFSGRISEVDSSTRAVVVKSGEAEMTFPLSDMTRIRTEYGDSVPFSELRNGMEVTAEYLKEGNTIQTLSIKTVAMASGFGAKQKAKPKKK